MPGEGRPWRRERDAYKQQCKRINAQCWLCRGTKGPIDYDSADPRAPLAFTVDHVTPSGGRSTEVRVANWKPCHFSCNSSRGNGTRGMYPTARQW